MDTETLIRNRNDVLEAIAKAAEEAGRKASDVTLTAVSKTFPAETILPLLEAGHRVFGENRVQEAQAKWPKLRERFPDLELRLIGPLQSNKAKDAVALFDVIETVDRPKIVRVLAEEMERQGRKLPVFVQVNTGEEPQKAGVVPAEAQAFVTACREEHGLDVVGLMAIPPVGDVPAPHFALLKRLADRLGLPRLSMGMSSDYLDAVSLGATEVRVGSGIFGAREQRDG
ncbi:YggS family pyridoxal phosphate-dependent enzyme [Parvularcula lutaonensis]|uniref:Pyridoxal phosphate homeostasis protein n=1 Tax=Parvularcula lutaonensis TaxID=491923 RepID=A0ABV7M8Y7_9PROT|nr:YggS family pyridoxal phosphate-dependent enzyme [Parvularcula lutaonensis]GGY45986.1 YggS family pyridoxal phosphate enzyme [Parvularcula lutaonensis]